MGLAVSAAIAGPLHDRTGDRAGEERPPEHEAADPAGAGSPDPVDAFLVAWERSLTGTWAMTAVFTRTAPGVRVEPLPARMAQRPPDRLSAQFGSIEGRLGGRIVGCAPGPDGALHCRDGGPAPAFDVEVDAEVDRLAKMLGRAGSEFPLYEVADEGSGCFSLALVFDLPAPPYGTGARFCFDAATGAPVLVEVRRAEATDRRVASQLRAALTDEDLRLPVALEP